MTILSRLVAGTIAIAACAVHASASTIAIGSGAFGPGSTLTTFTGVPNGTEVNGMIVDGITFSWSLGNGKLVVTGPLPATNNLSGNAISKSMGPSSGILTLTFPSLIDSFGYGFTIMNTAVLSNATTIALFNGAVPVGSLSYGAAPDPANSGGFAGIESTLPFNRVEITFDPVTVPAFQVDNIRTATAVPEPSSLLLCGSCIVLGSRYRQRRLRGRQRA